MANFWFAIVLAIVSTTFGFGCGERSVARDCSRFGAFYVNGQAHDCKLREKSA